MRLIPTPLARTVFIGILAFSMNVALQNAFGNDKQSEEAAKALLKRAAEITSLQAAGARPFLLVAKTSWTQYGKTTNGQFAMAWQAADRYRREATLPGFLEAVVVSGNMLYRSRNAEYIPLAALRPASLVGVADEFREWPTSEIKLYTGTPPKQLAGTSNYSCISSVTQFPRASVQHLACFDNSTGVPLVEQEQLPAAVATTTYDNYAFANGVQFPRKIEYNDTTGVRGEIEITKLEAVTSFPESTFQRPDQSTEQAWCADPTKQQAPERTWGMDEWLKWNPGPMVRLNEPMVFVSVNVKGDVQSLALLDDSANRGEREAASMIRRDKFPVWTCGEKAIPYETVVRLMRTQPYE